MEEILDTMTIGNEKIPIKICELNQADLKFYAENPRIYSSLPTTGTPSQEEIENLMKSQDHVKKLKEAIISNGGLIDPLIVRDGDYTVLEGNSRLAAYRIIVSQTKDLLKWSKVKVKLLPADVSEKVIFQFLGQCHIIGKKDWDPFEQANYLYRRQQATKLPIESMAKELGITTSAAKKMIDTFTFMKEHNDLKKSNWSYYEEYLKNASIKKYRKTSIELDDTIIKSIKGNTIRDARDIRKLGDIAKVGDKQSKKIMYEIASGDLSLYDGYEKMKDAGKFDDVLKRVEKIRNEVLDENFEGQILLLQGDNKGKCKYDLSKIKQAIERIESKL